MMKRAKTVLKQVFGYDDFWPLQGEVIENILNRRDTLVVMPTGGGKSLCYQIPALVFEGLTVVVSPLIALMKDQVDQLRTAGVAAVMLNSSLAPDAYRQNVQQIKSGSARLLYVAPETLVLPHIHELLSAAKVKCLAIDEAHCISEWGHDFRPEYRQIAQVRERFEGAVCTALTATATERVRQDIQKNLGFKNRQTFIGSFDRKNLFLGVKPKDNPYIQIRRFLEKFPDQAGIIYCATRKQVDGLAEALTGEGLSVLPYHAGMSDKDRQANQERFIRDDARIIVATVAFGMGINKPDIRFVIHYDLPRNIESYYQEIGRAGRDGLRAECLMLMGYGDLSKIKHFINQKEGHEKRVANIHLNAFLGFAECRECRRIPLLKYFGEEAQVEKCNMCDNCLDGEKEKVDLTVAAQKFLSCVYRTGELFGAGHIIDVLRGSQGQKVVRNRHDKLSTYGIGLEYSKKQWQQLARQFLHQGLMTQDMEYGGLRLTAQARLLFKGKLKVEGFIEDDLLETAPASATATDEMEYDHDLFQQLRKKRKEIADRDDVPPYVVFPDKSLRDMAARFPQSEQSMLEIHGVGAARNARYGGDFLEIITTYCPAHGIEEKILPTPGKLPSAPAADRKPRYVEIGEAYNSGQSVEHIMETVGIKLSTVVNHFLKYRQAGNPLRADGLEKLSKLSDQEKSDVMKEFEKLGCEMLNPVFKALDRKVSYDELHLLRVLYLARQGEKLQDS
jgi:ATP-dependent DNA helicase RecQ